MPKVAKPRLDISVAQQKAVSQHLIKKEWDFKEELFLYDIDEEKEHVCLENHDERHKESPPVSDCDGNAAIGGNAVTTIDGNVDENVDGKRSCTFLFRGGKTA